MNINLKCVMLATIAIMVCGPGEFSAEASDAETAGGRIVLTFLFPK